MKEIKLEEHKHGLPFNLNNYNKGKENGKSQIRDPEKRYEFVEESLQQGHF
jgi:hypothetical protein